MRIGVVIDASCDLPRSFLEDQRIHVLPSLLDLGGKRLVDDRDPDTTMQAYRRYFTDRELPCASAPCSIEEMSALFLEQLVPRYDRVLVIAPDAARSRVFQQATDASYAILASYRERRQQAGLSGSFALRILDSGSLAAGQGVLAWRASSLAREGDMPFEKYRAALASDAARVRCLIVPGDLYYLRNRGLGGPGEALGAGAYALGKVAGIHPVLELAGGALKVVARGRGFPAAAAAALDRARQALRSGIGPAAVILSFGGDPRILRDLPAYQDLEAQAASQRVELHLALMSATTGARLGPGALTVGWIDSED